MVSIYMATFNTLHCAHVVYLFISYDSHNNYFLVQHSLIGFNNGNTLCSPENGGLSLFLLLQPAHVLISSTAFTSSKPFSKVQFYYHTMYTWVSECLFNCNHCHTQILLRDYNAALLCEYDYIREKVNGTNLK